MTENTPITLEDMMKYNPSLSCFGSLFVYLIVRFHKGCEEIDHVEEATLDEGYAEELLEKYKHDYPHYDHYIHPHIVTKKG